MEDKFGFATAFEDGREKAKNEIAEGDSFSGAAARFFEDSVKPMLEEAKRLLRAKSYNADIDGTPHRRLVINGTRARAPHSTHYSQLTLQVSVDLKKWNGEISSTAPAATQELETGDFDDSEKKATEKLQKAVKEFCRWVGENYEPS